MDLPLVAGIDGGGSRTRAVLVRADGARLGAGESGPSNPRIAGEVSAAAAIVDAVRAAFADAALAPRRLEALVAGVAGVADQVERDRLGAALSIHHLVTPGRLAVDHDLAVALAGALSGRPGIAVIAGTGAAAFGRDGRGETHKAGGWGGLFDDHGSAHRLVLDALAAGFRGLDGRGPETNLLDRLAPAFGAGGPRALLRAVLGPPAAERATLAALAPLVLDAARDGDVAALGVMARGAAELASMAAAVAARLQFPATHDVAAAGGLLGARADYRAAFTEALAVRLPGARVIAPERPPEDGAALLALGLLR